MLLARVGLLLITVVTFITSFDAVSEVAVSLEAVAPNLGWTIPLALDGLIVVGSAVLWSESLEDRWHLFPLITVIAAAVLSVTANIAHAGTDSVLGQALAGVPPVALILAVELAAWQIRRSLRRSGAIGPVGSDPASLPRLRVPVAQAVPPPPPPPVPVPAPPAPAAVSAVSDNTGPLFPATERGPQAVAQDRQLWERILELAKDQPTRPTEAAVARALNEPRSAVRRAIASRREEWDQLAAPPEPARVGNGKDPA